MNIRRTLIHAWLKVPFAFRKITGRGPFGLYKPTYHHGFVDAGTNLLKAALFEHHVKQFSGSACSVASVVTAINAARMFQGKRFRPVTQPEILDKVTAAHWKERMGPDGYRGRRGLPLALLERVVKDSLDAYQIDYRAVETVLAHKQADRAETAQNILRQHLDCFEKKGDRILIAHFDQGVFVPTLNIPHISPVGGFNLDTDKVLMLDVDPEQERRYSVSFPAFYKGLASDYHHVFRPFGYGSGGCVVVRLA